MRAGGAPAGAQSGARCPLGPGPLLPWTAPPGLGLALVHRLVVASVQPSADARGPQRCQLPTCPWARALSPGALTAA